MSPLANFPYFGKNNFNIKKGHYIFKFFALLKSLVYLMSPDTDLRKYGKCLEILSWNTTTEATFTKVDHISAENLASLY